MIVTNRSEISKEVAFDALYKSSKRNLSKRYIYALILFLFGLGIVVYAIASKNQDSTSMSVLGGTCTSLGIAVFVYTLIEIVRSPKNIKKQNPGICEYGVIYEYKFREQGCDLVINVNGKKAKGTYSYEEFKVVYEHEDSFEIRLGSSQVLYALKSGFENERMIEFFKKNLSTNKKLKIVDKKDKKK